MSSAAEATGQTKSLNGEKRKDHLKRLLVSVRVTFNVTLSVPDVVRMSNMNGDLRVSLYP